MIRAVVGTANFSKKDSEVSGVGWYQLTDSRGLVW